MKGSVLITGGAGFIGFHLAKLLVENGFNVCLVDNYSRGLIDKDFSRLLSEKNVSFHNLDLLDHRALLELGSEFTYIFHLGAIVGVQHVNENPYEVLVQNVRMLENVISLSSQQKHCERLLFASTSEVYAGTFRYFNIDVPTPENTALTVSALEEPRTTYMLSKIMGEAMLHHAGIPFTIFRPHNIYGPRMGLAHVIPEQLRNAFEAKSCDGLSIYSPEHTRTFCFIDDAVQMLCRIMRSDKCIGLTLNLGNEYPEVNIEEVVEMCIRATGKKLTTKKMEVTPGSPARRSPDTNLLNELINYESKVSLKEGIGRTWSWYKQNVFEGSEPSAR